MIEVEDEEMEQRLVVCIMCSHIQTSSTSGPVCGACNCALLVKARNAEEMCPELKWEGDDVKAGKETKHE